MKETDEQADKEIHWVRFGRILSTGSYVPGALGCITLPAHRRVHQLGSYQNPGLLE